MVCTYCKENRHDECDGLFVDVLVTLPEQGIYEAPVRAKRQEPLPTACDCQCKPRHEHYDQEGDLFTCTPQCKGKHAPDQSYKFKGDSGAANA